MRRTSGTNCFSAYRTACATVPSLTRYRRITACMSPPVCPSSPRASPAPDVPQERSCLSLTPGAPYRVTAPKQCCTIATGRTRLGSRRCPACMWRCSDGPTAGQGPAAEPPSSPFDDDQVLGVRPEPRRVCDLDPPGNRAVGRRRGRQRARVLTRYDAVFLVGRGERDLGQGPAIHRREGGGIEGASRDQRFAALPQDEQEARTALFLHDAALLQLILRPHHVVDRVGLGGHVVDRVLQRHVLGRQFLHLVVEGRDRLLLIIDHALQVLNRGGESVLQAVGERGELAHPLLALLQLRLEV